MSNRPIELDFVARPRRVTGAGALLVLAGLLAAGLAVGDVLALAARRADLATELDARSGAAAPVAPSEKETRASQEAAAMRRELELPWSRLFGELESASHDTANAVAVLGVEPDPDKRQVRIVAEARTLADALTYVERLYAVPVLRYPVLESHETRTDDPQHAVRVKIVAGWRL